MDCGRTPHIGIRTDDHAYRQEIRLPPSPTSAGAAREFVASRLRAWGRCPQVDDAVLIIGEMFNNALMHAPSPDYVVAIGCDNGKLRLEMWDSSPCRPTVLPLDLEDEHGRGMRLVSAMSEKWGSWVTAAGKCVWAILPDKSEEGA